MSIDNDQLLCIDDLNDFAGSLSNRIRNRLLPYLKGMGKLDWFWRKFECDPMIYSAMGFALDLAQMEIEGNIDHLEHGLSSGIRVFDQLLSSDGSIDPADYARQASEYLTSNYCWSAQSTLNVDIQLEHDSAEDLLDDLSEFLWNQTTRLGKED